MNNRWIVPPISVYTTGVKSNWLTLGYFTQHFVSFAWNTRDSRIDDH